MDTIVKSVTNKISSSGTGYRNDWLTDVIRFDERSLCMGCDYVLVSQTMEGEHSSNNNSHVHEVHVVGQVASIELRDCIVSKNAMNDEDELVWFVFGIDNKAMINTVDDEGE